MCLTRSAKQWVASLSRAGVSAASALPPDDRLTALGSASDGPDFLHSEDLSVARWDEEAALSSPQVVCGLHTDSKSKGESGHEGRYQPRDHRMRPGRQDQRGLSAVQRRRPGTCNGPNNLEGHDGVLRASTRTRRDRGGTALSVGERAASTARAPGHRGEPAAGEVDLRWNKQVGAARLRASRAPGPGRCGATGAHRTPEPRGSSGSRRGQGTRPVGGDEDQARESRPRGSQELGDSTAEVRHRVLWSEDKGAGPRRAQRQHSTRSTRRSSASNSRYANRIERWNGSRSGTPTSKSSPR